MKRYEMFGFCDYCECGGHPIVVREKEKWHMECSDNCGIITIKHDKEWQAMVDWNLIQRKRNNEPNKRKPSNAF